MSTLSTARRGLLAPGALAAVLLGAVPLVSACGTGKNAPTRLEYAVADGVQAAAGNVVLRNLQLVADTGDTEGGATALELTGVIANNTGKPDRLTSVTATSAGAQVPFGLATSGTSGSAATSSAAGGSRKPSPTAAASSAEASASASAAPSASASASAQPSASASASAQPSASASASAQPSASASASASAPAASSQAPAARSLSLPVDPGAPLVLGTQGKRVQVDLKQPVLPGAVVSLTFTFEQSGATTVAVPVYSLASRTPGASQSPVTYPKPDLPEEFNQSPYDLASAAPSS